MFALLTVAFAKALEFRSHCCVGDVASQSCKETTSVEQSM